MTDADMEDVGEWAGPKRDPTSVSLSPEHVQAGRGLPCTISEGLAEVKPAQIASGQFECNLLKSI